MRSPDRPINRKSLLYKRVVGGVQAFGAGNFQSISAFMTHPPFSERIPRAVTTSVVFASPHSGRHYPAKFREDSILDERVLRSSEDAYMDELIESAPDLGARSLIAEYPRAYVDLNRSETELDPAVLSGMRRGYVASPRVNSGLGVIPRVVSNGRPIYSGKIPLAEGQKRLREVWQPYHERLTAILDETLLQFGEAILVDCHSMPHEALEASRDLNGQRPDVVLGDRFGAAASAPVVEAIESAFKDAGLLVARNTPFAGAYVTQRYGKPAKGFHAVQVEVDRRLYLDEAHVARGPNYERFRKLMAGVMAQIADIGRPLVTLAAE